MKRILLPLVLVFGLIVVSVYLQFFKTKTLSSFGQNPSPQTQSDLSLNQKFSTGSSFNILLLGYGGGSHDGANLTDSIILAHFDTKSQIITLISIPRDIWLKIPTNGHDGSYWKINAAFALGLNDTDYPNKLDQFKGPNGGGNLAKYELQTVTGLPIDRYLAADFQGFVSAIDILGGVDVMVDKTFDDFEYPIDGKENDLCGHSESELSDLEKIATISATEAFPCRFEHIHFDQGMNHFDGATALKFVRSRHSLQDGTDFGRSNRQRNLLVGVKNKFFSLGTVPKLGSLFSAFQNNYQTDLSSDDITALLIHAQQLKNYQIKNLALTNQNYLVDSASYDGQAILLPKAGQDQWGEIQTFLSRNLDNLSTITSPVIKVENGTTYPGLAELATNRLKDKDFNVLPAEESSKSGVAKSEITVFNSRIDPQLLNELKQEFGVDEIQSEESQSQPFDILITVGEDYNQTQGKKFIN